MARPNWDYAFAGYETTFITGPGTYVSKGQGAYAQLVMDGLGCTNGYPTGTFTIYDLVKLGGDQATITRLLLSFELHCNGVAKGCFSFNE